MITILSASNREENLTALFAKQCQQELNAKGISNQLFSLNQIPDDISLQSVYQHNNSVFTEIAKKYIEPADKFLFVLPEYNGSMPGILKLFIDAIAPPMFSNKKAVLIGVAAGRAGNLRGMDHLTDVLHHLGVHVLPQKLPISGMNGLLVEGKLVDKSTLVEIEKQVNRLIEY